MRILLLLFVSGLLLTISSCKNSYRITVKEPAVIPLPSETRVIGVINNVTEANSPEKPIAAIINSKELNGNVAAAERAVDGVLRALTNSRDMRGEIFAIDSTHFGADGELDWTVLDSIAKERGIDGFVELCEIRTISPVGGTLVANATGQTRNRLTGTVFMNVHVVETGENFERFSATRSYNIPISGSTNIIDLLNDIQRKREYYRALGFQLGFEVGSMIYPNWVWVGRKYYTRGTPAVRNARHMLREGNWDLAERTLLQDEEYHKRRKRARVLFNLALANEGQGELDNAILFAERAASEGGSKLANEYLMTLRNRKRQLELIDQQNSAH
ncbi:MAG: DUF6340 family protein [bacterium]|nr:DUF6340 family protein [bacterium]